MLKGKIAKFGAVCLTCVMAASLFAGCGGGDKEGNGKTSQVVTYNLGAEPKTIDPALNAAVDGATVIVNAFEGLTRIDEKEQVIPGVAEKWDKSPDGLKYVFHLRKEAKWSDGKPVKAQDFEYAWKRALKPETAGEYAYQLYYLKNGEAYNSNKKGVTEDSIGVKAKDDYTLEVTLEYPTAYFLSLCAFPTYAPVRKDAVEADKNAWSRKPDTYITNGPFKMQEWKPKDSLIFVKNPNYWQADKVKLEKVVYKMISQETSSLAAFKTGEMDYIEAPPVQEIPKLLKEGTAKVYPYLGTYFYCINTSNEIDKLNPQAAKALKNPKVRKALSLAIDRKSLVENVTKAGQIPATSFVPKGIPEDKSGKDFTKKEYYKSTADIETAKKLLAEAGYPNGKGFPKVTIFYNTQEGHQNIAQAVQDMLRKNLGINVELQNQEWKVFQKTRNSKQYEIARHGWIADYVDPMTFLDMWVTGAGNNDAGYSNQKYDELIKKAKMEEDQAKRMQYMHEAEDVLMEDMPIIPLYYYTNVACVKDYVKNVHKSPLGFVYFDHTYIDKEAK